MKEILGVKYLTTKEAAHRYGYSYDWFKKKRHGKQEPHYVKFCGKSKAYYPIPETDKWFKENTFRSDE